MKKTIIAGPWLGEFGWELMGWQNYLRAISKNHSIVCIGPKSSSYLYEDFCTDYIDFDIADLGNNNYGSKDGYNRQNVSVDLLKDFVLNVLKEKKFNIENVVWFPPVKFIHTQGSTYHHFSEKCPFLGDFYFPIYKKFGIDNKKLSNSFIFHARGRKDVRPEHNWHTDNWEKLKDLLVSSNSQAKFYSIGTKKDSFLIEGTEDWRGKDLESVCKLMNSSNAVFGPSSGAMHLASQSNAKVIVWSIAYNKKRYMEWWNPHKTPTLYLQKFNWHPTADYVYNKFKDWDKEEIKSDV